MRELTVRIRFTQPCLGNVVSGTSGRLRLPRDPNGRVSFPQVWHHANICFAADLLGCYQSVVKKILWDSAVDGALLSEPWFKRFGRPKRDKSRRHYTVHEAFMPGQIIGINCVVPDSLPDDAFLRLMNVAGRYKGLSPFHHGEYGHFEVHDIQPRRRQLPSAGGVIERTETALRESKHNT